MKVDLNLGPTIISTDLGNVAGSPQWSKCQWLNTKASISLMSTPPSARISMISFLTLLPGTWESRTETTEGGWLYQSFLEPRSNRTCFPDLACLRWNEYVGRLSHSCPSMRGSVSVQDGTVKSHVVLMMDSSHMSEPLGRFRGGACSGWI